MDEPVLAHRFYGNILTQDQLKSVLRPSNTIGFSVQNPEFTVAQNPGQAPTVTVRFSEISELRSSDPAGVFLNAGGTYTMTVTSNKSDNYMFFVQLNIKAQHPVGVDVFRDLGPKEGIPSAGTFFKYPGSNDQYIWLLPRGTGSASLTLVADDDYPICISDMILKSYNIPRFY